MKITLLYLCVVFGFIVCVSHADEQAMDSLVPAGGTSVIAAKTLTPASVEGDKMALAVIESISGAELPPGVSRGLRIATPQGFTADWDVVTRAPLRQTIRKGDVMLATFQARCHESMTGEAVVQFAFERNGEPYNKSAYIRLGVRENWTTFYVPFVVDDNYEPNEAHATFHLGFDAQAVDLADLRVLNYVDSLKLTDLPRSEVNYSGRALDSPWRVEADARIDKIRKADMALTLHDADGLPIPGALVQLTQTSHAFPFGTAIAVPGLLDQSADGERYRTILKEDFNSGVFENAMKWNNHEVATPEETDQALAWLMDAGFEMRGHVLVWPGWEWLPSSLKSLADDPAALKLKTEQRVMETATRFRGKLVDWDVLNEPFTNHDLMDILGNEVMVDWFKLAEAADPAANRYLNDWGILTTGGRDSPHQQHFEDTIEYLIDQGAPITGIGMQGHFGGTLTAPRDIWNVLDRFSRFNLPIKITELDIDLNDPALQADFMRDVLTAAFAHESIAGVTVWGFWAERHWRASAAHYDSQWLRRPVGEVWKQLTQETWWTDAQSHTDTHGQAFFRGFKGTYDLHITFDDGTTHTREVTLGDGGIDLSIDIPN